jgi:26S proteasome regulatory subunit T1
LGPYSKAIRAVEDDIKGLEKKVNTIVGIKESETGLSAPTHWDLVHDKQVSTQVGW